MARVIDANELEMFPYSEGAGTEEQIADWIEQAGLSEEDTADRARLLCWKVIEGCINVVKTQPTLTPPNEPLTLEVLAKSQLLQMLGEKVEVIRMGEMCQAEWATVRSFGDCKTDSGCSCCHELYGKTWIAYRRPPEGEEDTQ